MFEDAVWISRTTHDPLPPTAVATYFAEYGVPYYVGRCYVEGDYKLGVITQRTPLIFGIFYRDDLIIDKFEAIIRKFTLLA